MMQGKVLSVVFAAVVVVLTTGCGGRQTSSNSASNSPSSGSALTLASVTPDSAIVANPATVQVTGSGFDNSSVIMLDGKSVATTFVNSTTLSTTLAADAATQPTEVNVAVSNASSKLVSNRLQFYWVQPLALTSTALSPATQGANYNVVLTATGGKTPYTWATTNALPAGLTMSSSGTISGVPTSSGNYSVTITVSDSSTPAKSVSAALAMQVKPQSLTFASSALPSGTVSKAYSGTLSVTGGTSPYAWSISSGSLPAGLTLASATGVISGTPTTSGTSNFALSVSDSSTPVQKQSETISIVVAAAPVPQLAISSSALQSGTVSKTYSGTLSATGGTSPYTWSISSGTLPAGLTLASATGVISGTPTTSGTSNFTVSVSDSSSPVQKQSATTSIVIAAAPVSPLAISSSALPGAAVGSAYSAASQVSGGTAPYTWTITSGSLPAGLSLASATGVISGTPTTSGTSNFTVSVSDSSSPVQKQSATTSIAVAAPPLSITTASLPSGTVNLAYTTTVSETGGVAPYTWSVYSGALPTGLSLASTSGIISGTPSASGTFNVTLSAHDSQGNATMANFSVTIAAALVISTVVLPSATDGTIYAATLSATGGTPGYTWSIPSGQLPPGLTLAATTGYISGTPTATGTFSFTPFVSDSANPPQTQSALAPFTITVLAAQTTGGKTWYIRPDGGTRYSTNQTSGQCNGLADASYPGTGTNQACAFNDVRYLWSNGTLAGSWAISGGDTVIIRGGPWRIGPTDSNGDFFNGFNNNYSNGYDNPPIPAGTAMAHTRILGENYANCTATTQLHGGYGIQAALDLRGTQYVDVQCLELTDYSNCVTMPSAYAYPSACSLYTPPLSDTAKAGIVLDNTTNNILLQDLNIHGFPIQGIAGAVGPNITLTRVRIAFNGLYGWDFTNSGLDQDNAPGSGITMNYVTVEWNGCNEEYPIVDAIPAESCYDTGSLSGGQGFGDALSGGDASLGSFIGTHLIIRYNTKDGFIGPHTYIGNLSITDSEMYGNMGQAWKWQSQPTGTVLFQNNLTIANCNRLSAAMPGAPAKYNQYLSEFCRAGGNAWALEWPSAGGSFEWDNNTFIGAMTNTESTPVLGGFSCSDGVSTVAVSSGGSGYQVGDVLTIQGEWYGTTATVTSVSSGAITGLSLTTPGASNQGASGPPTSALATSGGHGTGATVNATWTGNNCNGGPRILRNNIFLGYTNTDSYSSFGNSGQIEAFCYTSPCSGAYGTTSDSGWTTRSHNIFYGFNPTTGYGACTYSGELCTDPLLVNEPSQTWVSETAFDNFIFNLTSGSPAKGAGTAIPGLTSDYNGNTYADPPSDGAVEFESGTVQTIFVTPAGGNGTGNAP